MRRMASWFAVLWTTGVAAFLLYGPLYATVSGTTVLTPDGEPVRSSTAGSAGLLAVEGEAAYVRVLLPTLVVVVPLLLPQPGARRVASGVAATLFGLYALLGMMSIGVFYVPPAIALAFAARGRAGSATPAAV